jgi:NADH:ubiquinone oxidoreductase subunit
MDLGTWLTICLRGRLIGSDVLGNRYYLEKSQRRGSLRARRWVVYAGEKEASAVPAEWHGWLHYTIDTPLPEAGKHPWQKPHIPNATGTPSGYRPPGHDYRGGHRAPADGDYETWTPGS